MEDENSKKHSSLGESFDWLAGQKAAQPMAAQPLARQPIGESFDWLAGQKETPPLDALPEADGETEALPTVVQATLGKHGSTNGTAGAVALDPTKRRADLLLYIGIFLIGVAVIIAGFLIWRHVSTLATYSNLKAITGFDWESLEDPSFDADEIDLDIDWEKLKEINPDIVGWLYVPGTKLSYPIVQGSDNSYYLNHTADDTVNASGAIFLDYQNNRDFSGPSNFIYGHNMLGNTMFSEMTKYLDEQFIRDHPRILILTPEKTYDLSVIGAIKCRGTDPVRRIFFTSEHDFDNFISTLGMYQSSGSYQSLIQAKNVYCFSTCELFDLSSRIIVIATDSSRTEYSAGQAPVMYGLAISKDDYAWL
ncbi:MAG: class B sortase [Coriobacteriia bacterium]|nr:class B sortase [Coriobacteriia bacterium]